MNQELSLNEFSNTPLYNIKAVVQSTEISSSTLRAWERRYNVCQPQRSDSGYRLYSDRDVAIIRWLKTQVDSGMSISQAVSWYNSIVEQAADPEFVTLPLPTTNGFSRDKLAATIVNRRAVQQAPRTFESLQSELLDGLLEYQEEKAEMVLNEAFALYTLEEVGDSLISPVLVEIGERWHAGNLSITREHYATNYMKQRLMSILRTVADNGSGPTIWVGCAPTELHEIGALMLAIYLRRFGYQVRYLGQSVPIDDLTEELREWRPAMILFSATTKESAERLARVTTDLANADIPGLIIGYGGRIFNMSTELRTDISGVFMGSTAQEAVEMTNSLLRDGVS